MPCETKNCAGEAAHRVFWPGRPPLGMCGPCALRADAVAQAMGLYLHSEVLTLAEPTASSSAKPEPSDG